MNLSRRNLITSAAIGMLAPRVSPALAQSIPGVEVVDAIVFDLPVEPDTIHPANAYSDIEWSIVHSIFDALIGFDADGALRPIAAERFEVIDDTTWEVVLRPGLTFHDTATVTAEAIARGFDLVSGSESQVRDIFGIVEHIEIVDELTARIHVSAPSPWLPAQMAQWHVLLPESFDPNVPIGSGPYIFDQWARGEQIAVHRYSGYQPSAAKGSPIANIVSWRFVPEATTRASDVISGASDIATFMPLDSAGALRDAGLQVNHTAVSGSWFVRIATDTPPFDDVRVRTALNLALDLDAFPSALIHEGSTRLASIQPGPGSLGFDPDLAPFAYDPEQAQRLLEETGITDLSCRLEITTDAYVPVCEAMIAQWAEVGVNVELVVSDKATFNAGWMDPSAPELRMASWSPLFDPSTLLGFVWSSGGFLSRYANADVDEFLSSASTEMDEVARAETYRQVANLLHDDAAAVFLWNLVNVSGVSEKAAAWSPRADQWVLPLTR
ncbi:MAG: ABC transporter substrate-binding protein [Thermomicrobiales bacterium]|nr:ABC transporter substrate-binding protein [Thermomicrobiales bacterium]